MTLGWMLVTRCAFFAPGAAPAGLGVPPEQHLRANPRGAEVAHRALGRFTAPRNGGGGAEEGGRRRMDRSLLEGPGVWKKLEKRG